MTTLEIKNQLLPILNKVFKEEYYKYNRTEYRMKFSYGKYSIYRWDYEDGKRTSSTLAKGLSKEEATGMMKLLQED
jgi:hypothetical protein